MPARPLVAVVGSRAAPRKAKRFAREVAAEAVRSGLAVVSGGARGCDAAAARGARSAGFSPSPLVEILPCGLAAAPFLGEGCALSLCPPEEPFSAVAAMRRNALVYAASVGAVVAHARLGEGGTWRGAAEARRRRLSPLLVRLCPEEPALRALAAMGAQPLASAADLGPALERAEHPRDLFSPLFA
jgi:DNA processing protein